MTMALYRKKLLQPMRPYVPGEDLSRVSVNAEDTPSPGGITVGRVVHYVSYGTPGGEHRSEHRAAIITAVHEDCVSPERASLCVLNPSGMFFDTHVVHSEDMLPGSWHWPERTA